MATEMEEAIRIKKLIYSAHQSAVQEFRVWAEMFGDDHIKLAIFTAADMIELKSRPDDTTPINLGDRGNG